jgi:hypothetical protein
LFINFIHFCEILLVSGGHSAGKGDFETLFHLHGVLQDHDQLQGYVDTREENMAILLNTTVLRSQVAGRSLTAATLAHKKGQYDVLIAK